MPAIVLRYAWASRVVDQGLPKQTIRTDWGITLVDEGQGCCRSWSPTGTQFKKLWTRIE